MRKMNLKFQSCLVTMHVFYRFEKYFVSEIHILVKRSNLLANAFSTKYKACKTDLEIKMFSILMMGNHWKLSK